MPVIAGRSLCIQSKKLIIILTRKKLSLQGGGEDRITAQHDKGKLTARERISILVR